MTSIDMHGFSVTLLPYADDLGEALLSDVATPDWPGAVRPHEISRFEPSLSESIALGEGERDEAVADRIKAACDALIDAEDDLDDLDARTGDGDAGSTIAAGARAVREELDSLSTGTPAVLCREIAQIVGRAMGGSSGVLLSILLSGTATAYEDGADPGEALRRGLETVAENGGAEPGQRTMVDALDPAADALNDGVEAAAQAAREGADGTAQITEGAAGRSSYLNAEDLDGNVDPGAEAVARAFEAYAAG